MPSLNTRRLVPGLPEAVTVERIPSHQCDTLKSLLGLGAEGAMSKALGVSLRLAQNGAVEAVALATESLVVEVSVGSMNARKAGAKTKQTRSGLAGILNNPLCIPMGVGPNGRGLPSPGDIVRDQLSEDARKYAINALWFGNENSDDVCLRAWLSACIGAKRLTSVSQDAIVSTCDMNPTHLACLSLLATNAELLEAKQSNYIDNEFEHYEVAKGGGKLVLHNSRFQNRVRHSKQTYVEVNGGEMQLQTLGAKGKQTTLKLEGNLQADIGKLRVVGRSEATTAQHARDMFFMRLLQGKANLDRSDFIRMLWFPERYILDKRVPVVQIYLPHLDRSQADVANAMVLGEDPFVAVHGPPGTGKTTVIAAALQQWKLRVEPVWVIAQSNVGVQNIAEHIIEDKIDFKLIVSTDFHFEWHEHLYQGEMEETLIHSNEFTGEEFDTVKRIGSAQIILCTLAMLSNPMLDLLGVFRYRPVEVLVVDEASQIDTAEFMHLFDKFDKLRKVCMFGDPNQLPPYGKEHARKMKTIFDFPHIMEVSHFLDIQRRMPVQLGQFLSDTMYNSQLKSEHDDSSTSCVRAIDVWKGREERVGSSWKNTEEANTVVNLVRNYYVDLKAGDVRIITPYDAQRATIMRLLKAAGLPSDIVFNVDSFQGHQAPYVIVSAVRTTRPGFLGMDNRVNVMLSRCKRGMVLVTKRTFIEEGGRNTLLGKLVQRWQTLDGTDAIWVDAMRVADGRADMPGAPGNYVAPLSEEAATVVSEAGASPTLAAGDIDEESCAGSDSEVEEAGKGKTQPTPCGRTSTLGNIPGTGKSQAQDA